MDKYLLNIQGEALTPSWEFGLGIMSNGKKICAAMRSCAQTQPKSLSRGMRNHMFTDQDNKY